MLCTLMRFGWDSLQGSHQQDPPTKWVLCEDEGSRLTCTSRLRLPPDPPAPQQNNLLLQLQTQTYKCHNCNHNYYYKNHNNNCKLVLCRSIWLLLHIYYHSTSFCISFWKSHLLFLRSLNLKQCWKLFMNIIKTL